MRVIPDVRCRLKSRVEERGNNCEELENDEELSMRFDNSIA